MILPFKIPLIADPATKPQCFGSPSVFSLESVTCKACAWFNQCHDASYAKLKAMSGRFDVTDMLARYERATSRSETVPLRSVDAPTSAVGEAPLVVSIDTPERTTKVDRIKVDLSPEDVALITTMPKKVQIKMRKLMQLNIDKAARIGVVTGKNPFSLHGNGYLHVAFEMLINGGFTRSTLRQCYQQRLGWAEGTAFPHVSAIVWLFPAMKIAIEERGVFRPNPSLGSHTK